MERAVMLIVDDVEMNRVILTQFFKDEYKILEADNGQEALRIIATKPVDIILLDLVMPVMDGFELLELLQRDEKYADIPVVVMTARNESDSEVRAMEMGAADFIKKPYNPTIVCCRIRNVMARIDSEWHRQAQEKRKKQIMTMHHYREHDALTDIYNRETFYTKTAALLQKNPEIQYDIIYLDISCFRDINNLFDEETGNRVLQTAAAYFRDITRERGLCGRMEADHFALCLPHQAIEMEVLINGIDAALASLNIAHSVLFYAGIYHVDNVFMPVEQMCACAQLTANAVKGKHELRYDTAVQRFAGDEALYKECLYKFLFDTTLEELLTILSWGEDVSAAEKNLYTIKGTAANLGMDDLAAAAECILEDIHAGRNHQAMAPHIQAMQELYEHICERIGNALE